MTLILALLGALLLAVLLTPALSLWFVPSKPSFRDSFLVRGVVKVYEPLLRLAFRFRWAVIVCITLLVVAAGTLSTRIGSEFVPRLSEGSIVLNVVRLAGISIEQSVAYNTRTEQLFLEAFPDEIAHIWSRTGAAEVATDPMGTELTDVFISLKPRSEWRRASSQEDLVSGMQELISDLPGQTVAYSQPIEMRFNEMVSGIRSDLGIKVYGDDFDELTRISDDLQLLLGSVKGAQDISGGTLNQFLYF